MSTTATTTTVRVKRDTAKALLELIEGQQTVDDVVQRLLSMTGRRTTAWSVLRERCGDDAEGLYRALRGRLTPHERVMADREKDREGTE